MTRNFRGRAVFVVAVTVGLLCGQQAVAGAAIIKAGGKCTKAQAAKKATTTVGAKKYQCKATKTAGATVYRWTLTTTTGSVAAPAKSAPVEDMRMLTPPTSIRFDGIESCTPGITANYFGQTIYGRTLKLRFAVTGGEFMAGDPKTFDAVHVKPEDTWYVYEGLADFAFTGAYVEDQEIAVFYLPWNNDELVSYYGRGYGTSRPSWGLGDSYIMKVSYYVPAETVTC